MNNINLKKLYEHVSAKKKGLAYVPMYWDEIEWVKELFPPEEKHMDKNSLHLVFYIEDIFGIDYLSPETTWLFSESWKYSKHVDNAKKHFIFRIKHLIEKGLPDYEFPY